MPGWSQEQVEDLLNGNGWLKETREIQGGTQYILTDETPVDWYKTGTVTVRGKVTPIQEQAKAIFSSLPGTSVDKPASSASAEGKVSPKRVFIVYGHDVVAREQLELILLRLKLEPIILQNLPPAGDTLVEKLETLTAADYACVLVTPDDEGYRRGCPDEKRPRARQNVVLELGMVLAKLGRRRVTILLKGGDIQEPSDIKGLIYVPFKEHVDEAKNLLTANLQEAGFDIQVKDLLS